MPDQKITELPANAIPALDDVLPIVADPNGTPVTSKVTLAQLLAVVYPVGSVVERYDDQSPADLWGFGTWQEIVGRVTVGVNAAEADFDTVGKTGGAKTVTLTENEIPAHSHGLQRFPQATGGQSGFTADTSMNGAPTAVSQVTAAAGGGQAHENMPPYEVVRKWRRTA